MVSTLASRVRPLVALGTACGVAAGSLLALPAVATANPCETLIPGSVSDLLGSPGAGSLSDALGNLPLQVTPWKNTGTDRIPQLQGRTQVVQMVTGRTSPNDTLNRFGVSGTDLGIPWDNGNGETLVAFGDTMGNCLGNAQWRSNVLFRSKDGNLADGMNIDSAPMERPGMAKSVLPRSGMPGERTVIPTAGVSVGGKQYMRYMSVIDWGAPGVWRTNYSGLAVSGDNGENWAPLPATQRVGAWAIKGATAPAAAPTMPDWQMSAFLKSGGFVYEYATPSGRDGTARVARVPEAAIEDPAQYRYFDGHDWVPDPGRAVPVLDGKVSELSVQWNDYLHKFVSMYTDAGNNVVMRQADHPEGPWSGPQTIVPANLMPTMYGAFMHPWSNGSQLYYLTSTWDAYNVFLMRTDLTGMAKAATDGRAETDARTTGTVVQPQVGAAGGSPTDPASIIRGLVPQLQAALPPGMVLPPLPGI